MVDAWSPHLGLTRRLARTCIFQVVSVLALVPGTHPGEPYHREDNCFIGARSR